MDENLFSWLTISNSQMTDFALLILRVFIGLCLVVHGLGKLGLVGTGSMQGFVGWLKSMNLPFPEWQARAAMVSEIAGGLLVTLGLFHRVGCLLIFITMLAATWIGHKGAGYLITNNPPGNEYTVNLAAIAAAMFLLGPGTYSIDSLLF